MGIITVTKGHYIWATSEENLPYTDLEWLDQPVLHMTFFQPNIFNIFLISQQKHMLCILNGIALLRQFQRVPTTLYFHDKIRKIHLRIILLSRAVEDTSHFLFKPLAVHSRGLDLSVWMHRLTNMKQVFPWCYSFQTILGQSASKTSGIKQVKNRIMLISANPCNLHWNELTKWKKKYCYNRLSTLGKIFSRQHNKISFCYFSQKTGFDIWNMSKSVF